jgi:hypothetical protein
MGTARSAIRDARALARATHAVLVAIAHVSARAAVVGVIEEIDAIAVTIRTSQFPARAAGALDTERRCSATDVSAAAAVIGIVKQVGAGPAAIGCPFDAPVLTPAGNARAVLIGTGLGAADVASAGSAETIRITPACVTRRKAGALL